MKVLSAVTAAVLLLCLVGLAQANVFDLGSGYKNLETVIVGNPANAADSRYGTYGSVSYAYAIGKYEVTAKQYADFLNNKAKFSDTYGLYNSAMAGASGCGIGRVGNGTSQHPYIYSVVSGSANKPVNYISYWDSLRFVNWLSNGQGNGDTETGTYSLNGRSGSDCSGVARRNDWTWALCSENEWYKAAYYDPSKSGGAGYWDYPTRSNDTPSMVAPTSAANAANSGWAVNGLTNVGAYTGSASAYGTFDQAGNVWEYNEAVVLQQPNVSQIGARGGSANNAGSSMSASARYCFPTAYEDVNIGFRVSRAVPEPSSIMALLGGLILLPLRRFRTR